MGSRSTARRLAMQAIYQSEVSHTAMIDALNNLFEDENLTPDAMEFSKKLAFGVENNKGEIDAIISGMSKSWSLERIDAVSKSILRLALYEMMIEKKSPKAVVINEAILLAKRYSDDTAAKFINGVLDAAVV